MRVISAIVRLPLKLLIPRNGCFFLLLLFALFFVSCGMLGRLFITF